MTDRPTAAGCTDPCIACMTDEPHDPAPLPTPNLAASAAAPSVPADADLRDRIRRAICEASGFTWLPDELMEPDEYGEQADAVLAVLPPSAYRRLLARLEADRASHLRATVRAKAAGEDELLLVSSTFASAFRHAAARVVAELEGPDAAQAYMQRTEGGEEEVAADVDLRDRIAQVVRTVPIRLGPNALAMAQRGESIILNMGEAAAFAEALALVLPESRPPFDVEAGLQRLADAVQRGETRAVPPAPADRAAEVWTVWPEDEPILGHYTDEVTAKLAAIEFHQEAESPGLDFVYGWAEHGSRLELLADGDGTGLRVKSDKMHGKAAPAAPADRAAVLREAADALDASDRLRDLTDDHMLDIHAAANELRRMADEAQQAVDGEAERKRTPMDPVHILGVDSDDPEGSAALRARLLSRPTLAVRADEARQADMAGEDR